MASDSLSTVDVEKLFARMCILSHPAMPGLLKIGYTSKEDVKERIQELSATTGVPGPFEIEYYRLTREVERVEHTTHEKFNSERIEGREFFRIDREEAVRFVESIVEDVAPDRYCRFTVSESKSASADPVDLDNNFRIFPMPEMTPISAEAKKLWRAYAIDQLKQETEAIRKRNEEGADAS